MTEYSKTTLNVGKSLTDVGLKPTVIVYTLQHSDETSRFRTFGKFIVKKKMHSICVPNLFPTSSCFLNLRLNLLPSEI